MQTIEFLAPLIIGTCVNNFLGNTGDYCNTRQSNHSTIKYYQSGKSCYVNGTFYTKCEDRLNGLK
jgi:hypothetical protein